MHISLIDVDGNLPNLALMKLSAYHKGRGDLVYLNALLGTYDKMYASCIFTWNARKLTTLPIDHDAAIVGGSGYDLEGELPQEVEAMRPDYSLYGIRHGLGFISRGCIRRCPFCIVPKKEGRLRQVAEVDDLINPLSNRVIFYDNNFMALPNCVELLGRMASLGLEVDFNQGMDIRLMTDEKARALSMVKPITFWRFALDSNDEIEVFERNMKIAMRYVSSSLIMVYVLVGYNTGWRDDLERLRAIQRAGVIAYFMRYRDRDGNFGDYDNRRIVNREDLEEILRTRSPRYCIERYVRLFNPEFKHSKYANEKVIKAIDQGELSEGGLFW